MQSRGTRLFVVILLLLIGVCHQSKAQTCIIHDTVTTTICGGQTYQVGAHSYTSTGSYIDTLTSYAGCDSIVLTNLTVDTTITRVVNISGCNQVTYNGTLYTSNTVLHQNYTYQHGCDSLVVVTVITITYTSLLSQSPTICQGQTFLVGTHSYGSSGFFIDTFYHAAVGGCDSIVHTLLTVIVPYPDILVLNDTCTGTYKGHTYTSSATVFDTLYAQTGCDSVYLTVTVNVYTPTIINHPQNITLCPGDSFFAGGHYQHSPGSYRDTVMTSGGCDSMITITTLSFLSPVYIAQRFDTCTAVTLHGVAYSADTIVADTLLSSLGCDSIIESDTVHIKATNITILSTALLPLTEGDSTQLIINPNGNYQNIIWSPNQWITNRYLAAPIVLPDVSTAYSVTAQDSNHCTVTAQLIVTVVANEANFVMPSAFTPNGDGINDTYGPILSPYAQLTTYHIYNRWGELVFDKDINGSSQWDGTFRSVQQPAGTYLYFITIISPTGATINKEGNFTLLR